MSSLGRYDAWGEWIDYSTEIEPDKYGPAPAPKQERPTTRTAQTYCPDCMKDAARCICGSL